MLNEVNPNEQPPPRRGSPFSAADYAFAAGCMLTVIGLALVAIPLALVVAGVVIMIVAWRLA